jgi:hypothetical protein
MNRKFLILSGAAVIGIMAACSGENGKQESASAPAPAAPFNGPRATVRFAGNDYEARLISSSGKGVPGNGAQASGAGAEFQANVELVSAAGKTPYTLTGTWNGEALVLDFTAEETHFRLNSDGERAAAKFTNPSGYSIVFAQRGDVHTELPKPVFRDHSREDAWNEFTTQGTIEHVLSLLEAQHSNLAGIAGKFHDISVNFHPGEKLALYVRGEISPEDAARRQPVEERAQPTPDGLPFDGGRPPPSDATGPQPDGSVCQNQKDTSGNGKGLGMNLGSGDVQISGGVASCALHATGWTGLPGFALSTNADGDSSTGATFTCTGTCLFSWTPVASNTYSWAYCFVSAGQECDTPNNPDAASTAAMAISGSFKDVITGAGAAAGTSISPSVGLQTNAWSGAEAGGCENDTPFCYDSYWGSVFAQNSSQ